MVRRVLSAVVLGCATLVGCAPAPVPPTPSPTAGPLLAPDSDLAEDNLCYAEDITLTRAPGGPTAFRRCVRAGVTLTLRLSPDTGRRFGDPTATPAGIAEVETTSAPAVTEVRARTVAAGEVVVRVPQPGAQEVTVTISVS